MKPFMGLLAVIIVAVAAVAVVYMVSNQQSTPDVKLPEVNVESVTGN